ncbi:MAG: cation transporter [Candidatus Polarisedimenticolaceae bacterium]|nr:cation transporter [Candidatus Polarisedimenticolaceae bacterium]
MIKLTIDGMSCGHCTAAVEKALLAVDGVKSAEISLDPGQALIEGDVEAASLIAAVADEGYDVRQV